MFKFPRVPSPSRLLPIAVLLFFCLILTTRDVQAQAPDDHGDTLADATPITLGTTVTGLISPGGDVDVFRFETTGPSADVWIYTRGGIEDTVGAFLTATEGRSHPATTVTSRKIHPIFT